MPRLTKNKTSAQPRFMIDQRLAFFVGGMMRGTYELSYGQLLTRAIDLLEPDDPDYEPVSKLEYVFATSLIDEIHAAKLDAFVAANGRRKSTIMRNALAKLMVLVDGQQATKKEVQSVKIHEQENQAAVQIQIQNQ